MVRERANNEPDRNTRAGCRTFLAWRGAFAQPEFGAMQFRPVILALGSNLDSLCDEIIALYWNRKTHTKTKPIPSGGAVADEFYDRNDL